MVIGADMNEICEASIFARREKLPDSTAAQWDQSSSSFSQRNVVDKHGKAEFLADTIFGTLEKVDAGTAE